MKMKTFSFTAKRCGVYVAQAVSICCTVSCTTSSFKGTTFSVRTGVVPGRYLYFIFLGERKEDTFLIKHEVNL